LDLVFVLKLTRSPILSMWQSYAAISERPQDLASK